MDPQNAPQDPPDDPVPDDLPEEIRAAVARAWKWLLALGILLVAVGSLAIIAPLAASIAVDIWVGIFFVVCGVAQIVQAFQAKGWQSGLGHVLLGALYAAGGAFMIAQPLSGLIAFWIFAIVMLIVSGVLRIHAGLRIRPEPGWGWLTIAGAVALAAAALIWASYPGSTLWLLGTVVGVSFIFEGWALVALALAARRTL